MPKSTWIPTKKEATLNDAGELVDQKVELERASFTFKDIIELGVKIIGLAAIATPIILFYQEQKVSLKTQKALKQLEVYSQTAIELSSICRRPVTSAAFIAAKDQLYYDVPPKVAFLFNDNIALKMDEINKIIPIYEAVMHNTMILDSIFIHGNESGSPIVSYMNEHTVNFDDVSYVASKIKLVDSCTTELVSWFKIFRDFDATSDMKNKSTDSCIQQMIEVDNKMLPLCSSFCSCINTTFAILKNKQSPAQPENKKAFASLNIAQKQLRGLQPEIKEQCNRLRKKAQQILLAKVRDIQTQMRSSNFALRS